MIELECYYFDDLADEIFWPSQPPVPVNQNSFVPYAKPSFWFSSLENENPITRPSVHKRMIDFLRTIPTRKSINNPSKEERFEFEKNRSYRHMINERIRREKQRNSYDALHVFLPRGTKNDKCTILQMAAMNLRELKNLKENLHKRNHELENSVPSGKTDTFRLRRPNPPSGIDSMIGVLTTMKSMGLKARSIQSEFSNTEFFAVLEIEPKLRIEAAMVENAVERALQEVERKFVNDAIEWKAALDGF